MRQGEAIINDSLSHFRRRRFGITKDVQRTTTATAELSVREELGRDGRKEEEEEDYHKQCFDPPPIFNN